MNHKRKRPKKNRGSCAMCKPHKNGWANPDTMTGHSFIQKLILTKKDLKDWKRGQY